MSASNRITVELDDGTEWTERYGHIGMINENHPGFVVFIYLDAIGNKTGLEIVLPWHRIKRIKLEYIK